MIEVPHATTLTVNVCDPDGTVGDPVFRLAGQTLPPASITPTSVAGCTTSKSAVWNVIFAPGSSAATLSVSDGVHARVLVATFDYNDAPEHTPIVTAPHPTPTVEVGRIAVDTIYVRNPGWHSAEYSLVAYCYHEPSGTPDCSLINPPPASITVPSGATQAIALSYAAPIYTDRITTASLTATYVSSGVWRRAYFQSTTGAALPPTVTVTPANGSTLSSSTTTLTVDWCDPDDGVPTLRVTSQGVVQYGDLAYKSVAGCAWAATSTFSNIVLAPWQNTFVATATDMAGHTTSASSVVNYAPPMSAFRPGVSPKGDAHIIAYAGAAADTFSVTNMGSYTTTYALMPRCGARSGCAVSPPSLTLSPGAVGTAAVSYAVASGPFAADTVSLAVSYAAPNGLIAADTGRRVLVEGSFTPSVSPKSAVSLRANALTYQPLTIWNYGTSRATYALSLSECAGALSGCAVTPATVTINPGGAANASLAFRTGSIGSTGSAHVVAAAPATLSGGVASDSATFNVRVVDIDPPTLSVSPAGVYSSADAYYDEYDVSRRPTITVDACDPDGVVGTPTLRTGTGEVAPTSSSAITLAGCASARRALFDPPLVAGLNRLWLSVSDGSHTALVTADYMYDDAGEHDPVLSMRNLAPSVPINRTISDTLWIQNHGWHSAQYALSAYCSWTAPTDRCALAGVPASVVVPSGGTVALPLTYTTPGSTVYATVITFVATYTNALGAHPVVLEATPTTKALLSPTITLTPSDGATIGTATVDLSVRWCDEDDGIVQRSVTWQGRPLTLSNEMQDASCANGWRAAWYGVAIDPWAQTLIATATDLAGHAVNASATLTRIPSLTLFQPRVTARRSTQRSARSATAADTFVVRNAGAYAAAYTLTATCASLSGCSASIGGVSLAPGDSALDVVSYTASGALDVRDTIRVVATYTSPIGSVIADTGKSVATVPSVESAPAISAAPDASTLPTTWVGLIVFTITNRSSASVTYDLAVNPTGGWGFPNWFAAPTTLTLEAGESDDVPVYTKAPLSAGSSGAYTLTAAYLATNGSRFSTSATSYWNSEALDAGIAVLPKDATRTFATHGTGQYVDFTVVATGNVSVSSTATFACDSIAAHCRWDSANADGEANPSPGVPAHLRLDFDPVSGPFHIVVRADANSSGTTLRDSATITMVGDGPYLAASVSPRSSTLSANVNAVVNQRFTITNEGNVSATFHYTLQCEGAIAGSCGALPRDSVVLSPSQHDSLLVMLRAPPQLQQSGAVRLAVSAIAANLRWADTGTVVVSSASFAMLAVDTRGPSAGANIARDRCLTLSAGDDAAFECGDLRLVHPLPATTTLGKARAPMLVYESRQRTALTLFSADVTFSSGLSPTSITASVKIEGRDTVSRVIPWSSSWPFGRPYRIVVPVDASMLHTGAYHYTFAIDATDGATRFQQQDTGTVAIVNRAASQFGPGWWLDGFEQLAPYTESQMLWVGGDGSTRLYTRSLADTAVWIVSPSLDRPDSLVQAGGAWYRRLRNGAYVQFDGLLRHVATVDAQGHRTTFAYDPEHALTLASITLPVPAGSSAIRRYGFAHDPSTQHLVRVDAPSAPGTPDRSTVVSYTMVNGAPVVSGISDPDGTFVGYVSDTKGRITARVDRRGYVTSFQFDAGQALAASTLDVAGTAPSNISWTYCAAATVGLGGCAPTPAPSDSVVTWLAGPRHIGDTTWFHLDRFGAPRLLVDALHDSTRIERADPAWPLLVTKVVDARGHTTMATYDAARALPLAETDLNAFATSAGGVANGSSTAYVWDPRWDRVVHVTSPMGVASNYVYDAATGDRVEQSMGSTRTRRVNFEYDPATREVSAVTTAQSPTPTRYSFDSQLGNLSRVTSPRGSQSFIDHDYLGRDSVIRTPIDEPPGDRWHHTAYTYDLAGRVLSTVDSAQTGGADPTPQRLTVTNGYDREGNLLRVTRTIAPDPLMLGDIVVGADFDAANRKTREFDPYGVGTTRSWEYDPAGNVIAAVRAGARTTAEYDVLDRVVHRVVPGASNTYTPQAASDDQRFAYDAAGNLIGATNRYAQVRRVYTLGGYLARDSLRIATADLGDPSFALHAYTNVITYDLDGRRTTFTPASLGGLLTPVSYDYDGQTGELHRVSVVEGGSFTYHRSSAGLLDSLVEGDGTAERHRYDDDGREIGRTEVSPVVGILHDETIALDARGKRTQVNYSTLNGSSADLYEYDGMGGAIAVDGRTIERTPRDPLGNALLRSWLGSDWSEQYAYEPHSTRMHVLAQRLTENQRTDSLSQSFNEAGDLARVLEQITGNVYCRDELGRTVECEGQGGERRLIAQSQLTNAYDGDGRLVLAIKATTNDYSSLWEPASVRDVNGPEVYPKFERGVTEEYRYDALGRRVWVRAHRDPYCPGARDRDSTTICISTIERTIYDGDQVIAEIRQPGDDTASVATLENDGPSTHAPLNQFGLTGYVHGPDIDHPLELSRRYQGDVARLVLHYRWTGRLELATTLDGQLIQCELPLHAPSCENIVWPGAVETFGLVIPHLAVGPVSWWGTLAGAKENATGVQDLRNRQYDPRTGRFTQEDPSGLAGGANLYGFGGGDAVNVSDPFGLCPVVLAAAGVGGVAVAATWCAAEVATIVGAAAVALMQERYGDWPYFPRPKFRKATNEDVESALTPGVEDNTYVCPTCGRTLPVRNPDGSRGYDRDHHERTWAVVCRDLCKIGDDGQLS